MSSTLEIACQKKTPSIPGREPCKGASRPECVLAGTGSIAWQRAGKQDVGGRIDRIVLNPAGRKILVAGLGNSGYEAALFLLSKGAVVRCTDSASSDALGARKRRLEAMGAEVELGDHTGGFCLDCEMIVVSPGVAACSLPLVLAHSEGIPAISEIELAYRFCHPSTRIVAVTGTNGKTTTCELTNSILREAGFSTETAGNIGVPFVGKVLAGPLPDVLVVEISSFQLERIHRFRPSISVLLNITDDHLDRYESFQEYVEAKRRIAENQGVGDFVIVHESLKHLFGCTNGRAYPTRLTVGRSPSADLSVGRGRILSRISGEEREYDIGSLWRLQGDHNLENAAAAIGAAELLGVEEQAIYSAVASFQGLHHRIEWVDRVHGVTFFDDSKATNVDAVVKALGSFSQPVILIAGGRDKGGSYAPLKEAARGKVKQAVLIGEATEKMAGSLAGAVPTVPASDMDAAVDLAFEASARGDVVLLSPGCSSFDMFPDYKQRGQTFQRKVKQLKQSLEKRRRNHEAA